MSTSVVLRRGLASAAILLSGCLLLVSCSSSDSGTNAASGSAPVRSEVGTPAFAGSAAVAAGRSASQTAALLPSSQSIIYTASLTIRAHDVSASAQRAISIAEAAGGYVAGEHESTAAGTGHGTTVSLTLKIPVSAYQTALGQLSAPVLGKRLSMQQQATDVTEQVANVASLVTSQEDAISALQGLLRKAGSVAGLLQVQQQISTDESTLNSLEAQQRALAHETTYATVTMTLLSPKTVVHKKQTGHRGFLAGLGAGWRALRHATAWLLTALGAVLPFLLVLALLGSAGYWGWRRARRNRPRPTPAA